MHAADLPLPSSIKRRASPLPVTLAVLGALLAVKLTALLPPLPAWTSEDMHATVVVDGGARAVEPTLMGQRPTAPVTTTQLAALPEPAAGPVPGTYERLRVEPFLEEREALARQQEALQVRQVALEVAERRLRGLYDQLDGLRAEVDARLGELEARDEERLAGLVKLYEAMKPKKAALIFDELDFDVLAPLALDISERKLAPIVAAMEPRVARRLTAELARRRHDASLAEALPPEPAAN